MGCLCTKYDWDTTDSLNFEGKVIRAKVVSVYDGDTVKVTFPFRGKMFRWNCRLKGVDTPEIRTKDPFEKTEGYAARDALKEKILNKPVVIACGKFDKYGRLLVDINTDGESVTDWLIANGHGIPYDGGKKITFKINRSTDPVVD
jgi:endonuclease YncB( thermonuclease family)